MNKFFIYYKKLIVYSKFYDKILMLLWKLLDHNTIKMKLLYILQIFSKDFEL